MNTQYIPINSLRLCIDCCSDTHFNGHIAGVGLKDPILFTDIRSLITQVDNAFDCIGKPQPHQIIRSFKTVPLKPAAFSAEPPVYHQPETILKETGKVKTLDLLMVSRQHAEWQGILKDTEGNVVGHFNSMLKCIEMITEK